MSPTAGTIFDKTRTPLTVWFAAGWHLRNSKNGISATWLRQAMELGSYQTAWAMLHRFRSVMVRPDRQRLIGRVEVDEAFIGSHGGGIGGRGAVGKTPVAIGIEVEEPQLLGAARMAVIDRATTKELKAFITANIEPGTTVVTDGFPGGFRKAVTDGYEHERITFDGTGINAHELLPGVHMVTSLCKRWLLGTMHGAASPEHLQSYLDEFVFRFNRRHSHKRGLLFYRLLTHAAASDPLTYHDMRKAGRNRPAPKTPGGKRIAPPSLALPDQGLPWRNQGN